MKMTIDIDDALMRRLREEAARRGTTMSSLAEAGIRRILDDGDEVKEPTPRVGLPTWRSGGLLVDVSDREELYRAMDPEASPERTR
jgi:predicted transcriptional regulator